MRRSRRSLMAIAAASLITPAVALPTASAQPVFTQRTMLGSDLFDTDEDSDFWINAVAPADVDGDGDLDLGVIGFHVVYFQSVEEILVVFHNEGAVEGGWLSPSSGSPSATSRRGRPTWPGATTTTTGTPT